MSEQSPRPPATISTSSASRSPATRQQGEPASSGAGNRPLAAATAVKPRLFLPTAAAPIPYPSPPVPTVAPRSVGSSIPHPSTSVLMATSHSAGPSTPVSSPSVPTAIPRSAGSSSPAPSAFYAPVPHPGSFQQNTAQTQLQSPTPPISAVGSPKTPAENPRKRKARTIACSMSYPPSDDLLLTVCV
jgi:hypothetical protein